MYECCKMVGGTSCGVGVDQKAKGTRFKKLKGQD